MKHVVAFLFLYLGNKTKNIMSENQFTEQEVAVLKQIAQQKLQLMNQGNETASSEAPAPKDPDSPEKPSHGG